MSNKAGIIAKIRSALTLNASITTRSKHEEFLHTDTDSILEAIYSDVITESSSSPSIFIPITDIEYALNIMKVGRRITISGVITNNGTNSRSSLLNISNTDYVCADNTEYKGLGSMTSGEIEKVRIINLTDVINLDQIQFLGFLLPNESIDFTLTYNAKN